MTTARHILKVSAIILGVSLAGYLLDFSIHGSETLENTLEILAELFSIFVSFSIFGVTWYAYGRSRDNHALFLGAAFFVIGFIDLFHVLSYPFMPAFITPNLPGKSAVFWNMARTISAPLFLASAYLYKDTLPRLINRPVLLGSAITLSLLSLIAGVFYHDFLPATYYAEGEVSILKIIQVLITAIIILYASYLYTRRIAEKNIEIFLVYGFIIVVFSDLIYFSYEISGHLLKVAGFYYIYLALYRSSVELPYEKLALAEDKLRQAADEKYRNLFDNANDAIIIHDIEGRVISWNHAAEKIFGWTEEEIIGKELLSRIVPEELRVEIERAACSIVPEGVTGFETVFLRKDGSRIDASLTTSALRDANQNIIGMSCIIRDITEHKKAEKTLKKSKEFIETVLNSMNDAISVIDVNDFRIIDVNTVFLESYGLEKEDVIGKTCHEITHKRAVPCIPPDDICPLFDTLNTGKHSTAEHVHYMKDGEKRYVEVSTSPMIDENGKVVNVIHVAKDITQRMQMLEQLRQKNQFVKATLESLPYPFYVIDTENYTIKLANSAAHKQGLREGSYCYVAHKNTKPCDTKDHQCPLKEAKKTKKPVTAKHIHFDENGKPRNVEVHCYPIFDNEGNVNRVIEYTLDITDRQKIKEIRLENERLFLANRAKSEFLATMSHELRTPLNAVLGFSELLKQKTFGELNDKQKNFVENIVTGGNHLLNIIGDILEITSMEAEKLGLVIEKISVPEIITEALAPIKETAAGRNIVIKTDCDPTLEFIEADKKRFKQILSNLLSNAVKFSKPEGGTVTVTARKEGDMARVSVSDTGIGIKEEDMGKLFMRFRQIESGSSRRYGGTGLGLAITKQLVELHGGKLWAESRFGEGSMFTFLLPIEAKKLKE